MEARLRRFLHCTVAALSHYSGALPLSRYVRRRVFSEDVGCVLGFHRVLKQAAGQKTNCLEGMVLTEETFVLLLAYLRDRFQVVPLSNLLDTERIPKGRKPFCALTFDDGWNDTYETAYPWLKRYGMPATVFITTDVVDSKGGFWIECLKRAWAETDVRTQADMLLTRFQPGRTRKAEFQDIVHWLMHMPSGERQFLLDHLPLPPVEPTDSVDSMVTWDQVIEMSQDQIEIGGHTASHPLLTFEDDATIEAELLSSKRKLEEKLHKPVRSFAYPNGDWDARVRGCVERAGYDSAVTTKPGWYTRGQDQYTIGRIVIHEGGITDASGRFSPAMLEWALGA